MECIQYIENLILEIDTLKQLKEGCFDDIKNVELSNAIQNKQETLNRCKSNLYKLSNNDICYRIYVYMLDGLNPSKAVEKVAEENYINGVKPASVGTIWKNYYKKVKKSIE